MIVKKQAEALGKSVEEAKQKALEQLGEVDAEKVEYIVLEEAKKGFLGIGASPARVLATYTVEDDEPAVRFIKTMIADMGLQLSVRVADGEGEDDGKIINIASVAACQPVPYIGVYAASKAFVLSYSRALNRELDDKDISVMAVCPFWTKTEFFDHAVIDGEKPVVKKYAAMYEPQQIVARAWRDAKRGKDVSKFGFIARAQMALVKILPHGLIMDIWLSQQKL